MTRNPLRYGPALVAGGGILLATLVAKWAAAYGWPVMAAPLLLALAFGFADALAAALGGGLARPSRAAVAMGRAFVLSGAIVALRDPDLVATLIPVIGPAGWLAVANDSDGSWKACRSV